MKFYSKTRYGNKFIISICGIKFKYKIKSNTFLDNLFKEWQTEFQPLLLEQKLRTLIQSPSLLKDENKEIFLVFASTLIENDKADEAKEILSKYIKNYGLEAISYYPLVSDLACKIGYDDEEIKKCAHVWNILEQNRINASLENYLKNKKIAIVGNSPNLVGKQKGTEIDSADTVIRFNNFSTQNFEKDYGVKTNIWVCCQAGDIINRSLDEINKMDYILYNVDLKHTKLQPKCLNYIYQNLKSNTPISYIGDVFKKDLKQYGIVYPSSGLSALYHFHKLCQLSKNNIYGFSFLENSTNYYDHYFQKRSAHKIKKFSKNGHHNFELENVVLRNIFEV